MADDEEDPADGVLYNCSARLLARFGPVRNVSAAAAWSLNRTQLEALLLGAVAGGGGSGGGSLPRDAAELLLHCLFPPAQRPFRLPPWQKVAWAAAFALMLCVAAAGNAIVMWIVLAHRRMRTVTNCLLVNLSVADLLMSLLNCTFNFVFMVNSDWPFGVGYCTANNFISHATVAASAFTLVAISADRYMAIVRPLQHSLSRKKVRIAVVVVWASSTLLAAPCLLYSTTMTRRYAGEQTRTVCYMEWPDGTYPDSRIEYMYNILFLGLTYLVPVTVMLVCYTRMAAELWGAKAVGEMTRRQFESIQAKRKVILMFIIVVSIFAICWLPYHGFFIYSYHNTAMTRTNYVQHVYLAFYWFGMANAMVNPAIYYWMNSRFRLYFNQVLCLRCCVKGKNSEMFHLPTTKASCSNTSRSRSANYKGGAQTATPSPNHRLQEQETPVYGGVATAS